MSMRKGRGNGRPLPGPGAGGTGGQVMGPDTTPPGRFRRPFTLYMLRPGTLVSVDRKGNPLASADVVGTVIRTPKDLQIVANHLTAGKVLCAPHAFTMQCINGLAASLGGLVDDSGVGIEYVQEERKEPDNVEGSQDGEEAEDEGAQAAGAAGSDD